MRKRQIEKMAALLLLTDFTMQGILFIEPYFIVAEGNCTRSADNVVSVLFYLN